MSSTEKRKTISVEKNCIDCFKSYLACSNHVKRCRGCAKLEKVRWQREWGRRNIEKGKIYFQRKKEKLKRIIFEKYGNGKIACTCCGESHIEFLCIDHIDGGGGKQRKALGIPGGMGFYRWLKKNFFPSGYQTLCNNCNQAKFGYGKCPHEK